MLGKCGRGNLCAIVVEVWTAAPKDSGRRRGCEVLGQFCNVFDSQDGFVFIESCSLHHLKFQSGLLYNQIVFLLHLSTFLKWIVFNLHQWSVMADLCISFFACSFIALICMNRIVWIFTVSFSLFQITARGKITPWIRTMPGSYTQWTINTNTGYGRPKRSDSAAHRPSAGIKTLTCYPTPGAASWSGRWTAGGVAGSTPSADKGRWKLHRNMKVR